MKAAAGLAGDTLLASEAGANLAMTYDEAVRMTYAPLRSDFGLLEAVDLFEGDEELCALLGKSFAATYAAIKRAEFETFMEVISPWEREYLLLNV